MLQKLVGHNIYRFDLVYLVRSSMCHNVDIPPYLNPCKKYQRFDQWSIDTMYEYAAGEYNYMISLETLAMSFGMSYGKTGKGKDFYLMSRDDQEEYLQSDLHMTEFVYKRLASTLGYEFEPIIFDIETMPKSENQIGMIAPKFDPDKVAVGNLKDPAKVEAKINAAEENHLNSIMEKAALHAHYSDPCAIGYIINGKVRMDFHEPKELLTRFWDIASKVWGNNKELGD